MHEDRKPAWSFQFVKHDLVKTCSWCLGECRKSLNLRESYHSSTENSCKTWKAGWKTDLLWAVKLRINEKYRRPYTRMSSSFCHKLRSTLTVFCLRKREREEFCWDLRVTAITQQLPKWQQQNFAFVFFFPCLGSILFVPLTPRRKY